ncbi:MAG: dihydrofolate reductase family protein [Thermoplasmata archaeon]
MERTSGDRPLIWINCAMSADGRLAYAEGRRARLSSPEDLERVHRLRAHTDGILVGIRTVLLDDPGLGVDWDRIGEPERPGPVRLVVDSRGRTPASARVREGRAPTLVVTTRAGAAAVSPGTPTLVAGEGRVDLAAAFRALRAQGMERILVEGGGEIIASLLAAGLFDRWTVYVAPCVIGGPTAPSVVAGGDRPPEAPSVPLRLRSAESLGDGLLLTWEPATTV